MGDQLSSGLDSDGSTEDLENDNNKNKKQSGAAWLKLDGDGNGDAEKHEEQDRDAQKDGDGGEFFDGDRWFPGNGTKSFKPRPKIHLADIKRIAF